MDALGIATVLISVVALLLGVANFVRARRDKELANEVEAQKLIDSAYEMLATEPGGTFQISELTRRPDARVLIQRAALLAPSSPTVIRWQGIVHEADGNEEMAKRCFEQLLRSDRDRWRGYMDLARIHDGDERIHYYEQARMCDSGRAAEPLHSIAKCHDAAGRTDEAIECAQRSIDANPKFAPAHHLMGSLCRKAGKRDEAKEHFGQAIEIDSNFVDPMVSLGHLLIEEGRWDEGHGWIQQAMRAKPSDDFPHAMLAAIHADRKEPEGALRHAARAMELNPEHRLEGKASYYLVAEMTELLETRSDSSGVVEAPNPR